MKMKKMKKKEEEEEDEDGMKKEEEERRERMKALIVILIVIDSIYIYFIVLSLDPHFDISFGVHNVHCLKVPLKHGPAIFKVCLVNVGDSILIIVVQ